MALSRYKQPDVPEIVLDHLNSLSKLTTIDLVGGILCHICNLILPNKKDYENHHTTCHMDIGEIVYTCVVCMKPFFGYRTFRDHCYLMHVTKDKFKCQHCDKKYSKQSVLLNHIKQEHDLECVQCDERFNSKKDLQFHQAIHKKKQNELPYLCNACGKSIYTADMCEEHIDEYSIIKFPCPICDEVLPTKTGATKHIAKHFNKTTEDINCTEDLETQQYTEESSVDVLGILCCYCDTILKNRTEIDLHILEEHNEKPIVYTCNICQKMYDADKYITFLNHCYFHLSKNKFECTECGKTFPRLSLFIVHTEAFHSLAGSTECANRDDHKPFECCYCQHAFKSQRRLVSHLRQDHGVRCIQCPEDGCNRSFESLKDLILHQREHNAISKNSCRFCGLQFASLASCANHIEVHRIKNYGCPICNKEYKEKYLLTKHIPFHFEYVLHICKICGKSYNARHRLMQHNKTHSEIRTYKCTYCGKGFLKSYTLQQHINIHTGMKPYECMVCFKTFASQPNWSKHVRRIHNIDVKKQKIDGKQHQIDVKPKKNVNNTKIIEPSKVIGNQKIERRVDSTSSDMSAELYNMIESDNSTMDSIASSTLDKELEIIKNNINGIDWNLGDLLSPTCATTITKSEIETTPPQSIKPETYPTELGPDFINSDSDNPNGEFINLDENILPYIDPLLTIKYANGQNENTNYDNYTNIDSNVDYSNSVNIDNNVNWEPQVFTCLYPNYNRDELTETNLMNVMETDIF